MQALGDAEWLEIMETAHQLAELPEGDRVAFMMSLDLDPHREKLVRELVEEFEPAPEFGVGSQIGRYVATGEIARGGTSQVFCAQDQELGRNVALKVLDADGLGEEETSSNLLREARAASSLSHPNIVTVFEVVRAGRLKALAMEYVPGTSLRSLMRRRLNLRECLAVWMQAAKALEAAHAAGIAHRDVKPENIMVRPDGLVKVLDFGMTRSVHDMEPGETTGTPRYMSPEQCRSLPTGVETDIFSLGVVFYEMITGRHPFEGDTAWDTMISVVEDAPETPSKWNPAISRQLDALILAMLTKNSSERPSATQVVESLERLAHTSAGAAALWTVVANTVCQTAAWFYKAPRPIRQVLPAPLFD